MRAFAIAILAPLIAVPALADERPVQLKKAPGLRMVEAQCGACHSLDYIVMNSPFMTAAAWDAELTKMVNAFGAPIDQADAKIIAEYLKANYSDARRVSTAKLAATRHLSNVRSFRDDVRSFRDAAAWRYYSEPYSAGR